MSPPNLDGLLTKQPNGQDLSTVASNDLTDSSGRDPLSSQSQEFEPFPPFHPVDRKNRKDTEDRLSPEEDAAPQETNSDTGSESTEPSGSLEQGGQEQWEDTEPDVEHVSFKSLFDEKEFSDLNSMLDYVRSKWDFDFRAICSSLKLDFVECVRLVNYIRSEVGKGSTKLDISSKESFADQKYLQPTLEDDALLYSLDEIDPTASSVDQPPTTADLEEQIRRLESTITEMNKRSRESYEAMSDDEKGSTLEDKKKKPPLGRLRYAQSLEEGYFQTYSGKAIHEDMLKDKIRTDAYRDFIYDNKHLFRDKVVLDVGCGTGILSMMCAKAGAKEVYAVDNSDIIEKARLIIWDNGLSHKITCIRGKMEEVTLPSPKVDAIISEWMGYGLLYEAMAESVLFARDRYLVEGGLIFPSHASIHIAPMANAEYISENVTFWKDVYGFTMDRMSEGIYNDARLEIIKPADLAAPTTLVGGCSMHEVSAKTLKSWQNAVIITFDRDLESLDAFVVWFDIFFASKPITTVLTCATDFKDGLAFTTGPYGKATHWAQVVLLIEDSGFQEPIEKGESMTASFGYAPDPDNPRSMDVIATWKIGEGGKEMTQTWKM